MMKAVVILALVASALAVPVPFAPDYPAVDTKVHEIETVVKNAMESVINTATTDNPAIGSTIAETVAVGLSLATAILEEADVKICAGTLTLNEAQIYFKNLDTLLQQTQESVMPDVGKLSEAAQVAIAFAFDTGYTQAVALVSEIYGLLSQKSEVNADYPAVSVLVAELQMLVRDSLTKVEETAIADNAAIGNSITESLEAAAGVGVLTLAEAQKKIDAMTLKRSEAELYLKSLETLLLNTQASIANQVGQLSAAAQAVIVETFEGAYVEAKAISEKIYALLD